MKVNTRALSQVLEIDMNQWKKIWSPRHVRAVNGMSSDELLENLIEADGFDSGPGRIGAQAWRSYVQQVAFRLGIRGYESIFEVGCGSGAFLLPFYQSGHKVGGIDFSRLLLEDAAKFMPDGDFSVRDAVKLSTDEKSDYLVANGVFFYFQSYQYASEVLCRMCEKTIKAVAVLDVPDLQQKTKCEELRRSWSFEGEYEKRYAGLQHLYFNRSWFREFGRIKGLGVEMWQQDIESYGYNQFRFNCILRNKHVRSTSRRKHHGVMAPKKEKSSALDQS